MTTQLWHRIAATPATITIETRFSAAEYATLQRLAERRGISIETVLRCMAACATNEEPTIYAGVRL